MRRQNIVSNEIFTCELSMTFKMALDGVLCSIGAPSLLLGVLHQIFPRRLMYGKTKPIAVKVRGYYRVSLLASPKVKLLF